MIEAANHLINYWEVLIVIVDADHRRTIINHPSSYSERHTFQHTVLKRQPEFETESQFDLFVQLYPQCD